MNVKSLGNNEVVIVFMFVYVKIVINDFLIKKSNIWKR